MAWVERHWIQSSPAEMARWTIACWTERFALVVEDLLAIPGDAPIVAEGAAFFPPVVGPHLSRRDQAIFLIPTEQFKRASHARRGTSTTISPAICSWPIIIGRRWRSQDCMQLRSMVPRIPRPSRRSSRRISG